MRMIRQYLEAFEIFVVNFGNLCKYTVQLHKH